METGKPPSPSATASTAEVKTDEATAALATAPVAPAMPAIQYPGKWLYSTLCFGLLLAMFLVALDMNIITTAIPTITAEFHSTSQIGWYGSAFFMSLAAFQAFWGKAYKYFPLKIVFLSCIGIFEIGSLIAALAPNSPVLIVGRAIQGLGGAGITSGCYTIIAFITPPKNVPAVLGLSSFVWSCASVLGPLLGGFFTQGVSWRWCFWINLPIGGTTMAIILLLFKTPPHSRIAHTTLREAPFLFDIPGVATLIAALVCILLALEDGGISRPWDSPTPIGLLVGFFLLIGLLVVIEWKQGEGAMLVPRIMKRRAILILCLFNMTSQASGFARMYNFPIYFQTTQGVSPSQSGIRTLPTVFTTSVFSIFGSILLGKVGYYKPFLLVGGLFLIIGSALIYTLNPHSPARNYIGYQIIPGIGTGLIIQINVIVAQAITPRADVAVTIAIVLLCQFVGSTIGVSAAQNILDNVMLKALPTNNPNITRAKVLSAGTFGLRRVFPDKNDLTAVINAYMSGLRAAWVWSLVLVVVAFFIAFGAEWKSILVEDIKKRAEKKKAATAAPAAKV